MIFSKVHRGIHLILILAVCVVASSAYAAGDPISTQPTSIVIELPREPREMHALAAEICRRQIQERTSLDAQIVHADQAKAAEGLRIVLSVQSQEPIDGFSIEGEKPEIVRIVGNDDRGLIYGIGKFLHTSVLSQGHFTASSWRGRSAPAKPVRGLYFATHFHNFYQDAPLEIVERYIQDLSLWGFNGLTLCFDRHEFTGIDDPKAKQTIDRLHAIMKIAKRLGWDVGLIIASNEAYANSPVAMRADWTTGHDGYRGSALAAHYHVELCPHKPGGMDLILKGHDETFKAFADVPLDHLVIWPYDYGGCTCSLCAPWGSNGNLLVSEPIARNFRKYFPKGKVYLSAWQFDVHISGEWAGLAKTFETKPDWLDGIMADGYSSMPAYLKKHPVPGNLPLIGFPEITMWGMSISGTPWGGFGAAPFVGRLESLFKNYGPKLSGGAPYCEGIADDINKVVCAQFYWDGVPNARQAVTQYLRYECSPDAGDSLASAIEMMQDTLPRSRKDQKGQPRFVIKQPNQVNIIYKIVSDTDAALPEPSRQAWRWRIIYLRALIDHELLANDFAANARCEQAFEELTAIYHLTQGASVISPPTAKSLKADRGM